MVCREIRVGGRSGYYTVSVFVNPFIQQKGCFQCKKCEIQEAGDNSVKSVKYKKVTRPDIASFTVVATGATPLHNKTVFLPKHMLPLVTYQPSACSLYGYYVRPVTCSNMDQSHLLTIFPPNYTSPPPEKYNTPPHPCR